MSAREDSRRAGYVWCLAQLGNSLPGYDDMSTEELRDLAAKRLREVNLDGGTLRHVTNELVRIARTLGKDYGGPPYFLSDKPVELVRVVAMLADWSRQVRQAAVERQAELEAVMEAAGWEDPDQLPQLRAAREERDMLTRARDAQAAELRTLREERDDAEERIAELQEALEAERGAPGPSQTRWSDILRERDSHRRRIAELEATLKVERDDDITDPESP
jgi:chromosome segregation ATPase